MVVRRIRKPMRKRKIDYSECVKQNTKKYTSRNAPPYPANKCCKTERLGNDGNFYVSVPNAKGICTWKLSGFDMMITKPRKVKRKSVKRKSVKRKKSRKASRKPRRKR